MSRSVSRRVARGLDERAVERAQDDVSGAAWLHDAAALNGRALEARGLAMAVAPYRGTVAADRETPGS